MRGTGDALNWNTGNAVTRDNAARSAELGTNRPSVDDGIGIRDCNCGDIWRFRVPYTPPSGSRNVEFWIGTTADACRNSANRGAVGTAQTCWQINAASGVTTQAVGGANNIDVAVPARWLVDPVNGSCYPPGTNRSLTGQLYFTAIFRPPDDATPYGSFQIDYNLQPPDPPRTVSAAALDGAARITWSVTATSDGGTSSVSNTIRGYYVLCLPGPPSVDGGTGNTVPTCSSDGFRFDAGTDASASGDDGGGALPDGGACGLSGLPTGFDPHDEVSFARYRCSALLGQGISQVDIRNLTNGVPYRFAVVSQDGAGNRAISSVTPCVVPQPVTDFWDHYTRSGGTARPGFCAVSSGVGVPVGRRGAAAVIALSAVVGTVLLRRRRASRGAGGRT